MWDTVDDTPVHDTDHLSRDLPCLRCGHAIHIYLACGGECSCPPITVPSAAHVA